MADDDTPVTGQSQEDGTDRPEAASPDPVESESSGAASDPETSDESTTGGEYPGAPHQGAQAPPSEEGHRAFVTPEGTVPGTPEAVEGRKETEDEPEDDGA